MKYSSRVKTHHYPWQGTLVYTPFASDNMISIIGSIEAGEMYIKQFFSSDEGDTFGDVYAEMLLEGTVSHSKKELQILLDTIGASLSWTVSTERLIFSGSVRPKHLKAFLAIIQEILLEPAFNTKELSLVKKKTATELALEAQSPRSQADIALSRILFSATHPFYAETTNESVQSLSGITAKQLKEFHRYAINRNSLVISIAGDITYDQAEKLVGTYFSKLPNKPRQKLEYPIAVPTEPIKKELYIKDKTSIEYARGIATGISDTHEDYPALMLGIQILGNGGFTGRLMQTVREAEGLTYDVRAQLQSTARIDGAIIIKSSFAPSLYEKGQASIARQIDLILQDGVTQSEMRKYAEMYRAKLFVGLSNSGACAGVAHRLITEGRTPAYFDSFLEKVCTLKASEVNKALKTYLVPEMMSESAAGAIQ